MYRDSLKPFKKEAKTKLFQNKEKQKERAVHTLLPIMNGLDHTLRNQGVGSRALAHVGRRWLLTSRRSYEEE